MPRSPSLGWLFKVYYLSVFILRKWLQQVMVGLNSDRTSSNSIPPCHAKQEGTHKTVRPFHWKVCIGVKKKKKKKHFQWSSGRFYFICLPYKVLGHLIKTQPCYRKHKTAPWNYASANIDLHQIGPWFQEGKGLAQRVPLIQDRRTVSSVCFDSPGFP